jgi:hypothetical protein
VNIFLDSADRFSAEFSEHLLSFAPLRDIKKKRPIGRIAPVISEP